MVKSCVIWPVFWPLGCCILSNFAQIWYTVQTRDSRYITSVQGRRVKDQGRIVSAEKTQ